MKSNVRNQKIIFLFCVKELCMFLQSKEFYISEAENNFVYSTFCFIAGSEA